MSNEPDPMIPYLEQQIGFNDIAACVVTDRQADTQDILYQVL